MNAPRNQFSEADFQRAWQAAKDDVARLRDLGIGAPATMRPEPYSDREDDHGNPMCHDCGCVHVRFHGDVCAPCAAEYRYENL